MQKENPNPTIHSTDKRGHASRSPAAPSLGSEFIQRYNLGAPSPNIQQHIHDEWNVINGDEDVSSLQWGSITAEDRSVALALSAAAYPDTENGNSQSTSTADDSVSPKLDILQHAGFALFHPKRIQKQCRAIRYPSYAPSTHKASEHTNTIKEEGDKRDTITANEVFDIIRNIQDPEHPLTLEQLNVVRLELIEVVDLKGNDCVDANECSSETDENNGRLRKKFSTVHVQFTPTIPHCSMATLIGLSLRVKLLRSLPSRFKVTVKIEGGTHVSEHAVNKQLADKERVRAALENEHLLGVVDRCISGGMQMQ